MTLTAYACATFSGQFQVWSFSTRAPNKVVSDRILPSQIWRVEAQRWCNVDTVCERSFERQWEGRPGVERKCLRGSSAHQGVRKVKIGHEMLRWLSVLIGSLVLWLHCCEKLQFLHVHDDPLWAASMETIQGASATSVKQLWPDSSFLLFSFFCKTLANRLPRLQNSRQPTLMLIPRVSWMWNWISQSHPQVQLWTAAPLAFVWKNAHLKIVFG